MREACRFITVTADRVVCYNKCLQLRLLRSEAWKSASTLITDKRRQIRSTNGDQGNCHSYQCSLPWQHKTFGTCKFISLNDLEKRQSTQKQSFCRCLFTYYHLLNLISFWTCMNSYAEQKIWYFQGPNNILRHWLFVERETYSQK